MFYITFYTNTSALAADKVLKENNMFSKIRNSPRGCGYVVLIKKEDVERVEMTLKDNKIKWIIFKEVEEK